MTDSDDDTLDTDGDFEPIPPSPAPPLDDEALAGPDDEAIDSESDESTESDESSAQTDQRIERASQAARKLESAVLAHIRRPGYQPVKPRVIAKQLKLPSEQHQALKMAIKRLAKSGQIVYGAGHLVRPAPKPTTVQKPLPPGRVPLQPAKGTGSAAAAEIKQGYVTGKFRRASAGFGFVRPSTAPRSADKRLDVYIPKNKTLDAASGDLVKVRVSRTKVRSRQGDMRVAGEIISVLERDTHQFVGVYRERQGEAVVDIDGKVFAFPVPVGDPGAKNAQPGDKVVVEMVQFPSHLTPGEAVITEVLGKRGAPGVDTLSIIREFGLVEEFSEAALDEARAQADKFDETDISGRLDLTRETIITIDPIDARDFDDAISLKRLENGHWQLGVHIADVSHFVKKNSPLDIEARDRGTSVYLPDRVIPMLPEIISNNLASLQPNKVRYTQTALIEFTAEGIPVASEFHRSAIKSVRRFTYEEVDEYLADREAWRKKLSPAVHELLANMYDLAMTLRRRRLDRGAIELTLPEVKIDLNRNGEVTGAHLVVNTESHQIIEDFMLAANNAVAQMLFDKELPFLRRVHEPPDLRKLQALTSFVRELGIECDDLSSRFEIKRVIAEVADKPEQHAVNYAVLRSMQKAIYSPLVEGHYALNSDHYCHFTSPIRRYPDLTIHRALEAISRGRRPSEDLATLIVLGDHCSDREQRAAEAERELTKVKLLTYLSKRIGTQMDAVVTGVEDFGFFAQGTELPAEGLVHVNTLSDDHYRFDAATHSLAGYREGNRFRLGDLVRVEVAHVDIDHRSLDFRFVKLLKTHTERAGGKKRGRSDKRGKERPAEASDRRVSKRKAGPKHGQPTARSRPGGKTPRKKGPGGPKGRH